MSIEISMLYIYLSINAWLINQLVHSLMCGYLDNLHSALKKKTWKKLRFPVKTFLALEIERITTPIIYDFRAKRNAKKILPVWCFESIVFLSTWQTDIKQNKAIYLFT